MPTTKRASGKGKLKNGTVKWSPAEWDSAWETVIAHLSHLPLSVEQDHEFQEIEFLLGWAFERGKAELFQCVSSRLAPGGHLEFPHLWPSQIPPLFPGGTRAV